MRCSVQSLFILPVLVLVSGCASTPDPATVCSAEWIAPRADKAVERIETKAKSSIGKLTSFSKTLAEGKDPNFLQKLGLFNAIKGLEKELTRGQGIKDLKTVATTCNDPQIVSKAMRSLFERQGVSGALITRIEENPIYQGLISSVVEPAPITPNG